MVVAQTYGASKLAFSDINRNQRLGQNPRTRVPASPHGLLKTPRTQLKTGKNDTALIPVLTHSKSQLFRILNTEVAWLNSHSTTALDTGMQRQDKLYVATSTLSVRMSIVLPMQKWNMLLMQKQKHNWNLSVEYFILHIRCSDISLFGMLLKHLKLHQFLTVQRTLVSAHSLMSGIAAQITLNRTHLVRDGSIRPYKTYELRTSTRAVMMYDVKRCWISVRANIIIFIFDTSQVLFACSVCILFEIIQVHKKQRWLFTWDSVSVWTKIINTRLLEQPPSSPTNTFISFDCYK